MAKVLFLILAVLGLCSTWYFNINFIKEQELKYEERGLDLFVISMKDFFFQIPMSNKACAILMEILSVQLFGSITMVLLISCRERKLIRAFSEVFLYLFVSIVVGVSFAFPLYVALYSNDLFSRVTKKLSAVLFLVSLFGNLLVGFYSVYLFMPNGSIYQLINLEFNLFTREALLTNVGGSLYMDWIFMSATLGAVLATYLLDFSSNYTIRVVLCTFLTYIMMYSGYFLLGIYISFHIVSNYKNKYN